MVTPGSPRPGCMCRIWGAEGFPGLGFWVLKGFRVFGGVWGLGFRVLGGLGLGLLGGGGGLGFRVRVLGVES